MYFAVFNRAIQFKKIIDAVVELVVDANIYIDPRGIHMQAMDSSHVCLCQFVFPPESLEMFDSTPRCIGLNLKTLQKILNCIKDEDKISLSHTPEGDSLGLKSTSLANDRELDVCIPLIDINTDVLEIPETDHTTQISIDPKEFSKVIKDLIGIGDVVEFTSSSSKLDCSTQSDEGVHMCISLNLIENEKISVIKADEVQIHLGSSYMRHFVKACAFSPILEVSITNEMPIRIQYKLENNIELTFMCAPRDISE